MPNNAPRFPRSYTAGHFVVTGYTPTHWELTENFNAHSESTDFQTASQALVFFVHHCMAHGYGIPIEACLHLCECLESDVNEAIRATALPTIH